MPTPLAPWTLRMDEVLADGEWHELEQVLAAGVKMVPPGMAYRKGEWSRTRRGDAPATRHVGTRETAVAAGARIIAKKSIESRIRYGSIVRWGSRIRKASP